MNINDYQEAALKTAFYKPESGYTYTALGLVGEAGEIANKLKKPLREYGDIALSEQERVALAKELGDVLWYTALLSEELGFSLSEVAQMNINKLRSRQERGTLEGNGDNR